MPKNLRYGILLGLSLVACGAAAYLTPKPPPELSRAQFLDEVRAGHVRSVDIEDQEVILGRSSARGAFRTVFHRGEDGRLLDELHARGVEIRLTKSILGLI